MTEPAIHKSDFIEKAESLILENIRNEQFGVSELAELMHISRSGLLRKIKTKTQLSASQFIRQVRLEKAMDMLRKTSLTVAEISYEVGFGNTSYFIKCFREQYGYSPGEVRKRTVADEDESTPPSSLKQYRIYLAAAGMLVIALLVVFLLSKRSSVSAPIEKSIAVLPFVNESSDSLNLYFVNGLMESTLNNLQKIRDLRVVSRTSVARYRDTELGIPEIAEQLNVNYLVEGSGQRVGDQVLLNIQLIEAAGDHPIWSEQYSREVGDVFALQNEIARKIADAIQAVVTTAELRQIEKKPTENLVAYDYYLRALEPYYSRTREGLEKAIPLFEKAIENDDEFALAYADIAISYYFLDVYQKQKQYTERINNFADKALLYDPKSAESLIAKALYYIQTEEYQLAVPHLEKALEYNPNSPAVVQMLGDLYARVIPNTAKYLEYALKGIQLDIAANDSVTQSYIYLHLSNALIQSGFVSEAVTYINKALDYNPDNYYAPLLNAFIPYAQDGDGERTKSLLIHEWNKDTTRLDILQEVGKVYYYQEDYDSAFYYFEKFVNARERKGLDIYQQEDIKISLVYKKKGYEEQARRFLNSYAEYCEKDQSIYKSASTAVLYAYQGRNKDAIEQLKIFASQDNYQYWILLFLDKDPILKPLNNDPEFGRVIQKINDRFWRKQENLRELLESKGLL
ncbi:helix-turn-helix domain-containing protein [Sunxiuqinia indica]|uniref:helix-turn-helix domain-containing protein n=1 Tax=Sunxiuqinia indica TaxID=2692584 RepID=UPI001359ED66|nr:helix-turn-helix domain-containing protein [Sunxiuqinia indica]